MSVVATACAKVILLGEHAVVHGQPALAVPLSGLQTRVRAEKGEKDSIRVGLPVTEQEVELLLEAYGAIRKEMGVGSAVMLDAHSTVPRRANLGSSASFCVAMARALAALESREMTAEESFRAALAGERVFHGTPSGVDPAVIAYEKPLYFMKGGAVKLLALQKPLHLVLADAGKRRGTAEVIRGVRPAGTGVCRSIGALVEKGTAALQAGDARTLGMCMNENHALLQKLGVSTEKTDALVAAARKAGALGAKATGAGGGGFMVALCGKEKAAAVEAALREKSDEVIKAGVPEGDKLIEDISRA